MNISDKVFFRINGRMYWWNGWFGSQLESREWFGTLPGAQRILFGKKFTVFKSERDGLKYRTSWTIDLPDNIDEANVKLHWLKREMAKLI
jgi:hypothetical protein